MPLLTELYNVRLCLTKNDKRYKRAGDSNDVVICKNLAFVLLLRKMMLSNGFVHWTLLVKCIVSRFRQKGDYLLSYYNKAEFVYVPMNKRLVIHMALTATTAEIYEWQMNPKIQSHFNQIVHDRYKHNLYINLFDKKQNI